MAARVNAGIARINEQREIDLANGGVPSQAYVEAFTAFDHDVMEMRKALEADFAQALQLGRLARCIVLKAMLVKLQPLEKVIAEKKGTELPPG